MEMSERLLFVTELMHGKQNKMVLIVGNVHLRSCMVALYRSF